VHCEYSTELGVPIYFAELEQSDNYWLNNRTPALTYGLRGISYYVVTVSGPGRDLHSGVFGRTVHEPMTDLISLLGTLVSPKGDILIKGVDEMVEAADADERQVGVRKRRFPSLILCLERSTRASTTTSPISRRQPELPLHCQATKSRS